MHTSTHLRGRGEKAGEYGFEIRKIYGWFGREVERGISGTYTGVMYTPSSVKQPSRALIPILAVALLSVRTSLFRVVRPNIKTAAPMAPGIVAQGLAGKCAPVVFGPKQNLRR
jgi:hypothetical protein